jgi:hypothetical protein
MSTKISNGYVLPNMTLSELTAFHQRVTKKLNNFKVKDCQKSMAFMCAQEIDLISLGLKKPPKSSSILSEMNMALYSLHKDHPNALSYLSNAVYLPLKNKILCIFYGSNSYRKIWENQPEVTFYGYWDNSDPDEECSSSEWNQRKNDWVKVLPYNSKPTEQGVFSDFTQAEPHMTLLWDTEIPKILNFMPSFEDRVTNLLDHVLVKKSKLTEKKIRSKIHSNITRKMIATMK